MGRIRRAARRRLGGGDGAEGRRGAVAALAVLVHSLAMLIVTGCIAILVYQSAGFDVLKRSWINLDLVWTLALVGMGAWLLLV